MDPHKALDLAKSAGELSSHAKVAWDATKMAGEISTKISKLIENVKDRAHKRQLEEIWDQVRELKRASAALEDENRDLREKLRFKSDDYEFRSPFWYAKKNPQQALCPKCFANNIPAPMGAPGQGCSEGWRLCLVCNHYVED